ncbi:MAG: 50S ribosomal protein L10 [Rhodospirillales bacterium]|nr:50S ribosomal protein L10 [Rhodospirillales bacterium]MDH3919276.1 50S ribosomal protein L10 [Rhodospirillales bacterium]MDH3970033.1 50S ribosomal protein L10 [Rhodospirillales bacterium]
MDRAQKELLVADLNKTFQGVTLVVVTHQTGLTVAEVTDLRRRIRAAGASFKVSKNRLARRALEGTKFQALQSLLIGPTAMAYSSDPVAAAKICVEFANKNDKLTIIGGALGEQVLDVEGVKALAKLPSLDELRGKLVGLLQAPAVKLAGVTQAPAGQLARVFSAYGSQNEVA